VRPQDDPRETDRSERLWVTVEKALVKRIDDYHHDNRFKSRSHAVEQLIEFGLLYAAQRNKNLT